MKLFIRLSFYILFVCLCSDKIFSIQEKEVSNLTFDINSLDKEKEIKISPKIIIKCKSDKNGIFIYRPGPKEHPFPFTGIDDLAVVADEDIYILNNGNIINIRTDVDFIRKYNLPRLLPSDSISSFIVHSKNMNIKKEFRLPVKFLLSIQSKESTSSMIGEYILSNGEMIWKRFIMPGNTMSANDIQEIAYKIEQWGLEFNMDNSDNVYINYQNKSGKELNCLLDSERHFIKVVPSYISDKNGNFYQFDNSDNISKLNIYNINREIITTLQFPFASNKEQSLVNDIRQATENGIWVTIQNNEKLIQYIVRIDSKGKAQEWFILDCKTLNKDLENSLIQPYITSDDKKMYYAAIDVKKINGKEEIPYVIIYRVDLENKVK